MKVIKDYLFPSGQVEGITAKGEVSIIYPTWRRVVLIEGRKRRVILPDEKDLVFNGRQIEVGDKVTFSRFPLRIRQVEIVRNN